MRPSSWTAPAATWITRWLTPRSTAAPSAAAPSSTWARSRLPWPPVARLRKPRPASTRARAARSCSARPKNRPWLFVPPAARRFPCPTRRSPQSGLGCAGATATKPVEVAGDAYDHQARRQDVATDIVGFGAFDEKLEQVAEEREAGDQRPDCEGAGAQAGRAEQDQGPSAQAVLAP